MISYEEIASRPRPHLLSRLWGAFSQSGVQRDTGVLAIGSTGAQIIQGVGTLLLGRLYSPAAFGVWFLVQSVAAFGSAVGGLRYELAIPLVKRDEEAVSIIALQAVCTIGSGAIMVAVLVLGHARIAVWLGASALSIWVAAAPVIVVLTALSASGTYWFLRLKQFPVLAKSRIAQSLGGVGLQAALAPFSAGGAGGLIIGSTAGMVAPVLYFAQSLRPHFRQLKSALRDTKELATLAKQQAVFPKYVVPYGFMGILRERGLVMLFAAYATTVSLGFYALALRIVNVPFTLLYSSLSPVLYQRAVAQSDRSMVAPLVYKTLKIVITITTPAFLTFAWFAPILFNAVLGQRWRGASAYAGVLIAPAYTLSLEGLFDRMFDLAGRQRLALTIELCYTVVGLASFATTLFVTKNTLLALAVFSAVSVAYHIVWIAMVYKVMRFPMTDLLKILVRAAVLGGTTFAVLELLVRVR